MSDGASLDGRKKNLAVVNAHFERILRVGQERPVLQNRRDMVRIKRKVRWVLRCSHLDYVGDVMRVPIVVRVHFLDACMLNPNRPGQVRIAIPSGCGVMNTSRHSFGPQISVDGGDIKLLRGDLTRPSPRNFVAEIG